MITNDPLTSPERQRGVAPAPPMPGYYVAKPLGASDVKIAIRSYQDSFGKSGREAFFAEAEVAI